MKIEKTFRERYPYLATWKMECHDYPNRQLVTKCGRIVNLKPPHWFRMPGHPKPPLDSAREEACWKSLEQSLMTPHNKWPGYTPKEAAEVVKLLRLFGPVTPQFDLNKRLEIEKRAKQIGLYVLKIQARFQNYEIDRDMAIFELCKKFLPQTMGGPAIPDPERRQILRKAYEEMKSVIKEIREAIGVPLSKRGNYDWSQRWELKDFPKELRDMEPQDIFAPSEIPLIAKKPSIRDTCIDIMHGRLKPVLKGKHLERKTLRNILSKTKSHTPIGKRYTLKDQGKVS